MPFKEIQGDLFASVKADAICLTTNGFITAQGANTMGVGVAGAAKRLWPGIQMTAGTAILQGGNRVHCLTVNGKEEWEGHICLPPAMGRGPMVVPYHILTLPVKPDYCTTEDILPSMRAKLAINGPVLSQKPDTEPKDWVWPGWYAVADERLIKQSLVELRQLASQRSWNSVVLPKPGCGAGGLSYQTVREWLNFYLDDRFYVIDREW
jgi:O-acetyl-ADP-ribose deacetylase (regulator of RNase III)